MNSPAYAYIDDDFTIERLNQAVKVEVSKFQAMATNVNKSEDGFNSRQEEHSEQNLIKQFMRSPVRNDIASFVVLRKSEGVVLSINTDAGTFTTTSQEIGSTESDVELSEFSLEEISDEEMPLLKPGAVFYWHIGYLDQPSGRTRLSQLRFRRLPIWTKKDLVEVERFKSRFASILK